MRPMRYAWIPLVLGLAGTVAGCGEHEFHPPSEEQRSARADSAYAPALFDSIAWSSDSLRLETGNLVFADECRRCHGPLGRGDTRYTQQNDLQVPSLVTPDWEYAGQIDSVRHRIFVGHGGMPDWGVGMLTPRQIDAAAAYILQQLRPDAMVDTLRIPD